MKDTLTLYSVKDLIKETMEKAPQYLKEIFNIDFDLPLKVDGEAGENWLEMRPVDEVAVPF